MSSSWYIHKDGQQLGPFSREQLSTMAQSGEIGPNSQVWADGMSNWIPASQLNWLFGASQAAPPSGPGYPPSGPVYEPPKKGGPLKIILIVLALLLVLGGGGVFAALTLAQNALRDSDVYSLAMSALKESPESIAYLGQSIEADGRITGSVSTSNGSGDADFSIPVKGSEASGTLLAVGKRDGGSWSLTRLELQGDGKRIDILEEAARLAEATITIENDLGHYDIYYIYYTLEGGDWSDDLLGDSVLAGGGSFSFTVEPGQSYDFQIVDIEGDTYSKYGVLIDGDYTWSVTLDDLDFGFSDDFSTPTVNFELFDRPEYDFTFSYPVSWSYELYDDEVWVNGPLEEATFTEGHFYVMVMDGVFSDMDEVLADHESWLVDHYGFIYDYYYDNEWIGDELYPILVADSFWYDLEGAEYHETIIIVEKEAGLYYLLGFFFASDALSDYPYEIDSIYMTILDSFLFK